MRLSILGRRSWIYVSQTKRGPKAGNQSSAKHFQNFLEPITVSFLTNSTTSAPIFANDRQF